MSTVATVFVPYRRTSKGRIHWARKTWVHDVVPPMELKISHFEPRKYPANTPNTSLGSWQHYIYIYIHRMKRWNMAPIPWSCYQYLLNIQWFFTTCSNDKCTWTTWYYIHDLRGLPSISFCHLCLKPLPVHHPSSFQAFPTLSVEPRCWHGGLNFKAPDRWTVGAQVDLTKGRNEEVNILTWRSAWKSEFVCVCVFFCFMSFQCTCKYLI